jgi:hypothetical protein
MAPQAVDILADQPAVGALVGTALGRAGWGTRTTKTVISHGAQGPQHLLAILTALAEVQSRMPAMVVLTSSHQSTNERLARVGGIDMRAQAEVLSTLRPDTPWSI